MAELSALPPELILYIVSFSTRESILDRENRLRRRYFGVARTYTLELVPDLPSINSLVQTNTIFHNFFNQTLYELCASVDTLGKLALLFAVEHQLKGAVDKFVVAGVSLDTEYNSKERRYGCSLLHIAAHMGLRDMVVKLLGFCRNVEEMKKKVHTHATGHGTALDWAVRYGHLEVVKLLAPVPLPDSDVRNMNGTIAAPYIPGTVHTHEQYLNVSLIEAVYEGFTEIAEFLLSAGANVNFVDNVELGSLLYHAAGTGNLAMVQLLLGSGADPNFADRRGIPPLFRASTVDVAQALVDAGATVVALPPDEGLLNAFGHVKTYNGLLHFFLENGIDPNHEDDHKLTPLHFACRGDLARGSVELLLKFGATTIENPDWTGRTPVDMAMANRNAEVVKILEPLVQSPSLKAKIATWWEEWEE
ncbi:ankyrin repeat-containing domain protein [Mycena sanguinolenta]|nr:ankyrin repeat-containing domain protein [Mycena sanguinolenta]